MRFIKILAAVGFAATLAACGGGAGVDSGGSTKPPVSTTKSIEVLASANVLPSATGESVTITAVLKNAGNNGVVAEAVNFSADSGVLQNAVLLTDAAGVATAKLSAGSNRSVREITVTVKAGAVSRAIVVPVSGTVISVAGASSILLGGLQNYEISLKDSAANPIAGAEVQLSSSLANTLTPVKVVTDNNGSATFQYTGVNSGRDTITATGAGVIFQQTVAVSSVNFAFTNPIPTDNTSVLVNTEKLVTVRYVSGGVGVAGQNVNFSSSRGTVSNLSVATDANGFASTRVSATTAGPAIISAQLAGIDAVTTSAINFFASVPATIVLQANPGAVPPNAPGTTSNSSALSAIVRDIAGNAVSGAVVNFNIRQDTSGGIIRTALATSDANGQVTTAFIPGSISTAQNGVVIRATVVGTSIFSDAQLTVNTKALFITITTNNLIEKDGGGVTLYRKPFAVQVNDANGVAVVGQTVTFSMYAPIFHKGFLVWNSKSWDWDSTVSLCVNEDGLRNGILQNIDPAAPNFDRDGNGQLTPRLPGVIAPLSVVTDSSGFAPFNLLYGEQYAPWISYDITARALVAGTESSSTYRYFAAGLASDFTTETIGPAGQRSPFGLGSCTDPF